MNNKIKKALTVLLTSSLVMGTMVITANADTDQRALDRINQIRQEAANEGLVSSYVPMSWSNDMEQVADIRAQESVAINRMDHTRPDGQDFWTVKSSSGQNSQSEVLAWSSPFASTAQAVEMWYSEKAAYIAANGIVTPENIMKIGHYHALINPDNQYVGLSTRGSFTVGEFTNLPGTAAAPAGSTVSPEPAAATASIASPAVPAAAVPAAPATPAQPAVPAQPAAPAQPVVPAISAPNSAPAAPVLRKLTPVSESLIGAMKALNDMTDEIPSMKSTVQTVNTAIAGVIPVVEDAFGPEMQIPDAAAPSSDVDPHVYEAAYFANLAADLVMDSVTSSAPEEAANPQVDQLLAQSAAWTNTAFELLAE